MNKKKTYGQQIYDHKIKDLGFEDDIIEYRKQMEKDIILELNNCVNQALKKTLYQNKDFYLVMLMKVEPVGKSAQTIILARQSCPSPVYKQSVWKYHHLSHALEFLWAIPDKILYYHVLNNLGKYLNDKETQDLAKFVHLMESGELLKWIKHENGEKVDAVIKITKENECQTIH
jgi:hypothetical protein